MPRIKFCFLAILFLGKRIGVDVKLALRFTNSSLRTLLLGIVKVRPNYINYVSYDKPRQFELCVKVSSS